MRNTRRSRRVPPTLALSVAAALAAACDPSARTTAPTPPPALAAARAPAATLATIGPAPGAAVRFLDLGDGVGIAVRPPRGARLVAVPDACDWLGAPATPAWVDEWTDAFAGITTYRAADYRHQLTTSDLFYPGAAVYHGTNTNSKTYLGACSGDSADDLFFEVHRGRVRAAGGRTVEHYGIGAAWTPSPPLGIAP